MVEAVRVRALRVDIALPGLASTAGLYAPTGIYGDQTAFGKPDVRIERLRSCDVWLADPVDQASLELAAPNGTARHRRLVAHRISKPAALPAKAGPFVTDRTVHLVRTGGKGPIDRAALEVVEPTAPVRGGRLVGLGISQEAAFPPKGCPLVTDRTVDLVRAGTGRPVDRPVREVSKTPDTIGCALLEIGRRAEETLGTAELSELLVDCSHFDLLGVVS